MHLLSRATGSALQALGNPNDPAAAFAQDFLGSVMSGLPMPQAQSRAPQAPSQDAAAQGPRQGANAQERPAAQAAQPQTKPAAQSVTVAAGDTLESLARQLALRQPLESGPAGADGRQPNHHQRLGQPADPPRAKPASQASGWPARQPDRATLAPGRTSHRPQRARAELERADRAHPRASACCAHAALKASAARAGQATGFGADRGKRQKAGAAASCAA